MAVRSIAFVYFPKYLVDCHLPVDCGQLVHQHESLQISYSDNGYDIKIFKQYLYICIYIYTPLFAMNANKRHENNKAIVDSRLRPQWCFHLANVTEM